MRGTRSGFALCALTVTVATAFAAVLASPAFAASATPRQQVEQLARAQVARYSASLPGGAGVDCAAPAGDPAPGTPEWTARDYANQYCATERLADEYTSPAFGSTFWSQTPALFAQQTLDMAQQPGHPHASLAQVIPGGTTADPFRTLKRWTDAGRGRVSAISFPANDGATLNGHIFEPPATVPGPYPAVVITTGSIQGYEQLYFWAAEGLAEAGYMVMTYDVQGQGGSDTLPANCTSPSSCPGVPFQQSYNFFQGAEDALNYFLSTPAQPYSSPNASGSTFNPAHADVDTGKVGIAGHSLGASAVSEVGQCDPRVHAIVAWDNLAPASGPCSASIPAGLPSGAPTNPTLKTPALGINSEYFFNPEPMSTPPDPQSKAGAYQQLRSAGTDTMQVALRSSTHLEYTYVPYILAASRVGERVAFHYTLAWFDRYLRNDASAYGRLTATTFDGSSDAHSIGAGTYSAERALANPSDSAAGNVPNLIAGMPVADRLSFYYDSEYSLTPPSGGTPTTCVDMRAGCP